MIFDNEQNKNVAFIGVRAHQDLWGGVGGGGVVTFSREKFTQFPIAWLLKSEYKRTQNARKTLTIYRVAGIFFVGV